MERSYLVRFALLGLTQGKHAVGLGSTNTADEPPADSKAMPSCLDSNALNLNTKWAVGLATFWLHSVRPDKSLQENGGISGSSSFGTCSRKWTLITCCVPLLPAIKLYDTGKRSVPRCGNSKNTCLPLCRCRICGNGRGWVDMKFQWPDRELKFCGKRTMTMTMPPPTNSKNICVPLIPFIASPPHCVHHSYSTCTHRNSKGGVGGVVRVLGIEMRFLGCPSVHASRFVYILVGAQSSSVGTCRRQRL